MNFNYVCFANLDYYHFKTIKNKYFVFFRNIFFRVFAILRDIGEIMGFNSNEVEMNKLLYVLK